MPVLRKQGARVWTDVGGMRQGASAGFCERGNETSGQVKGGEFIGQLTHYQHPMEVHAK